MSDELYDESDLFLAFQAGYDAGQDDAKDDVYSAKPFLRMHWERVREDYGVPGPDVDALSEG